MAGKVSTRTVADRRVVAHPAGTTAPVSKKGKQNKQNSKPAPSPAPPVSDLADHLAQVLTGKKKLSPTPEHLDLEAKVKKAWAEGYRGFEKREFRERDELFERPVLKVRIWDGRGYCRRDCVVVDRLGELAAAEGYTVS